MSNSALPPYKNRKPAPIGREETTDEFFARCAPQHPALYDACMAMAAKNLGHAAVPWIHLYDAVARGTISPMEAYDAIALGYLPETLTVRASRYAHLLT